MAMPVSSIRLCEAIEQYLRSRAAKHSPTTVRNEGAVLQRFCDWYGDVQVRHLRAEKVEDWFVSIRTPHVTRDGIHRDPVKATTFNYYRTRLNGFFTWATRRGLLKTDLLAEVDPLTVIKRQRLQPTPEQLLALVDAAENPRDRCYLALIVNTGFRAQTASRITVSDLDLEQGWMRVWINKTQEADQFPISSDLEPELRDWLHAYALALGRPLTGADHLFPASTGPRYRWFTDEDGTRQRRHTATTWIPERAMVKTERIVQAALAKIGLPTRGEGTHTVRRGLGRALFDQASADLGHDGAIRTVGALLHHSSVATTELYLGLSSEKQRRDTMMRGKPLLSAMVGSDAEVTPLRQGGA